MTDRRGVVAGLAAALVGLAGPARAQPPAGGLRRVAVLAPSTRAKEEVTLAPFFAEMRRLGWIEGRTIAYDRAYAGDRQHTLPRLAAELVARRPELIYAPPLPAAVAARHATSTISIVFATATDPVALGLVASLSHPGGNVTGIASVLDSLAPKMLEILREMAPAVRRLGLLGDPADPRLRLDREALVPLARGAGMTVVVAEASDPASLDAAVARLGEQRIDVILTNSSLTFNLRHRLVALADRRRVPVIAHRAEMVDAGALFSYGASLAGQLRRSAHLVDKVLNGASPADIPVEQPTQFEMVLNLRTARTLGVTIPPSIRLRADRVVE